MDPKKQTQGYKGNIVDELIEDEDFLEGIGKKEEETSEEMFDTSEPEQRETKEEKEKTQEEEKEEETKEEKKEEPKGEEEIDFTQELPEEQVQKLSPREKAFYYEMKKEREKRQQLEAQLEYEKLQEKTKKLQQIQQPQQPQLDIPPDPRELFKDKDPDEPLTKEDILKLLEWNDKVTQYQQKLWEEQQKAQEEQQQALGRLLDEQEARARSIYSDFDEKMQVVDKLIDKYPAFADEIWARLSRGEDVAQYIYNLGKQFAPVITGKTSSPEKKKVGGSFTGRRNTSASLGGNSSGTFSSSELSPEELMALPDEEFLTKIASLPLSEYKKLPKKVRQRAMSIG